MKRFGLAIIVCLSFSATAMAKLYVNGVQVYDGDANYNQIIEGRTGVQVTEAFQMMGSGDTFAFSSITHVRQHMDVLDSVIATIGHMKWLNVNKAAGDIDFGYGRPPTFPTGFIKCPPYTFTFKQANGTQKASDGLKSIENNQTRTECLTCLHATLLIAHRRYFGDAWIDNKYPAGSIAIDGTLPLLTPANSEIQVPGDYLYMKNGDYGDYMKAHPDIHGSWQGENTIYLGNNRFSGLGLQSETVDEMRSNMLTQYNIDCNANKSTQWALVHRQF